MIYTSYFAKMNKFPSNMIPVAICGGIPSWYTGKWYRKPAPKLGFFKEWKQNHDNNFYIEHYNAEVLDQLDYLVVLNQLQMLVPEDIREKLDAPIWWSKDYHLVLLCYEKSGDFCHRHLFADWLNKKAELSITEWSEN